MQKQIDKQVLLGHILTDEVICRVRFAHQNLIRPTRAQMYYVWSRVVTRVCMVRGDYKGVGASGPLSRLFLVDLLGNYNFQGTALNK